MTAEPGDMICVLFGGRVSYILRWNPEGFPYELLSDAYLHGILHEEPSKDLQSDDERVKVLI